MTEKDDPANTGPAGGADKRPHATLDLQATDVSAEQKQQDEPGAAGGAAPKSTLYGDPDPVAPPDAARHEAPPASPGDAGGNPAFFTHMAAGVVGALLGLGGYFLVNEWRGLPEPATQNEIQGLREQFDRANDRLAALETHPNKPTGGSEELQTRLQAATDDANTLRTEVARLASKVQELEQRPAPQPGVTPESVKQQLDPLDNRLSAVDTKLGELAQAQTKFRTESKAAALAMALYNLRRATDEGKPFKDELQALQQLAPMPLDVTALEARRDKGVPSIEQLQSDFETAANAALDAENQPQDDTVASDLWSRAKSLVRIRRKGDVEGDGTRAILARSEHRLEAGNLTAAIAEADKLQGAPANIFKPWLENAKARLAAEKALTQVETKLLTALGGAESRRRDG